MDFGKFILAFGKKLSLDRNGSESCIAELHGIKEAVSFASSQKSSAYCVKKPYCVADCEEAVHLLTTKKISKQTEKRDLARDIKSIWSSSWGTEVNLKEKLRDSTRFADCLAKLACYNKNFDTAVYLDVVKIPTLSSIASTEKLQRLLKEDKANADNFKKKWLNKKN